MSSTDSKIWSGRFWLTIITGIVFAYAVYKNLLNSEAVCTIITTVFTAYFYRPDRTKGGNQ